MIDEELYYELGTAAQKKHSKNLVDSGTLTREFLDERNKKVKNWTDKKRNALIYDMEKMMKELANSIEKGLDPSDNKVQMLMRRHYFWLKRTWIPTKENYMRLMDLYQTPEFRAPYDERHPKLIEFMIAAMKIFATREFVNTPTANQADFL